MLLLVRPDPGDAGHVWGLPLLLRLPVSFAHRGSSERGS
jgi:hypothetical protein